MFGASRAAVRLSQLVALISSTCWCISAEIAAQGPPYNIGKLPYKIPSTPNSETSDDYYKQKYETSNLLYNLPDFDRKEKYPSEVLGQPTGGSNEYKGPELAPSNRECFIPYGVYPPKLICIKPLLGDQPLGEREKREVHLKDNGTKDNGNSKQSGEHSKSRSGVKVTYRRTRHGRRRNQEDRRLDSGSYENVEKSPKNGVLDSGPNDKASILLTDVPLLCEQLGQHSTSNHKTSARSQVHVLNGQTSSLQKLRDSLHNLLPSLTLELNENQIAASLEELLKGNTQLSLEEVLDIESSLVNHLLVVDPKVSSKWLKILLLVELLKKTHVKGDNKTNDIRIVINTDKYPELRDVYNEIVELLQLLVSPRPDFKRIHVILTLLQNRKFPLDLLLQMENIVQAKIDSLQVDQWKKILLLIAQLKNNVGPNEPSPDEERDKWGIYIYIRAVTNYNFPSVRPNNENLRLYILKLLRLLKNRHLNVQAIYDYLQMLESEVKLYPHLVLIITQAVHNRLTTVDISSHSLWATILLIINRLKVVFPTDAPSPTNLPVPDDNNTPDSWGIHVIIELVNGLHFGPGDQQLRFNVLRLLRLLKLLHPNPQSVQDILLSLKDDLLKNLNLLVLIKDAIAKRLESIETAKRAHWKIILELIENMLNLNTPTLPSNPDENQPDKWSIYVYIELVRKYVFPAPGKQSDEPLRTHLLELLRLLRVPNPNVQRLFEILVLVENNLKLYPFLVYAVTQAVHSRLVTVELLQRAEWDLIINILKRLFNQELPTLPPSAYPTLPYPTLPYPTLPYPTLPYPTLPYPTLPSNPDENQPDKWSIHVYIELVRKYVFPTPGKQSDEPLRTHLLELLRLLRVPNPNVQRLFEILVLVENNLKLYPFLVYAVTQAVHSRLVTVELLQRAEWDLIMNILKRLFNQELPTLPPSAYPTLPYPTLPYPTLPYPTLPYPTLPYPTLPYPTLPYPTLPYPTLPYPTLPSNPDENQPDKWSIHVYIELVRKYVFPAPRKQIDEPLRTHLLELLRLLRVPNPNVQRLFEILVLVENNLKLYPFLVYAVTQAVHSRLVTVELLQRAEWDLIMNILKRLFNQELPTLPPSAYPTLSYPTLPPEYEKPDIWGIYEIIVKVLHFVFPSGTGPYKDGQRAYIIEILRLLKSLNPDLNKIVTILIAVDTEFKIHPDLLSLLSRATRNRLLDTGLQRGLEWWKLLVSLELLELHESLVEYTRIFDGHNLLDFLVQVLYYNNLPATHKVLSNDVLSYLKQLYIELIGNTLQDQQKIDSLVIKLKRYNIHVSVNILLAFGYKPNKEPVLPTNKPSNTDTDREKLYNTLVELLKNHLQRVNSTTKNTIYNILILLENHYKTLALESLRSIYNNMVANQNSINWESLLENIRIIAGGKDPQKDDDQKYLAALIELLKDLYDKTYGSERNLLVQILELLKNKVNLYKVALLYEHIVNNLNNVDWNQVIFILKESETNPSEKLYRDDIVLKIYYFNLLLGHLQRYSELTKGPEQDGIIKIVVWLRQNQDSLPWYKVKNVYVDLLNTIKITSNRITFRLMDFLRKMRGFVPGALDLVKGAAKPFEGELFAYIDYFGVKSVSSFKNYIIPSIL